MLLHVYNYTGCANFILERNISLKYFLKLRLFILYVIPAIKWIVFFRTRKEASFHKIDNSYYPRNSSRPSVLLSHIFVQSIYQYLRYQLETLCG